MYILIVGVKFLEEKPYNLLIHNVNIIYTILADKFMSIDE
jgi:hypothetical protein